jgi:hypothetical protein
MIPITDNTWQEMERLRGLAAEMGKDTDPLQLAVEELATYKDALRVTRAERDEFRRKFLAQSWSG